MGILVPLVIGKEHVHEALLDSVHEGLIITCLVFVILQHWRATGQL